MCNFALKTKPLAFSDMTMRRKTTLAAATLMLGTLAWTGCSDYDNGFTEGKLSHIQGFQETFGKIDPQQDWNLVERGTVTVTTSEASEVKIYALGEGGYSIVGDYRGVTGMETLGFDVVEGTDSIVVSDGKTAFRTVVGGSVSFGLGTRSVDAGTKGLISVSKIPAGGHKVGNTIYPQYKYVEKADYDALQGFVPEIGYRQTYTNLNNVTHDFLYVSTGQFIIYPYYWVTSAKNTIGVYYVDESGNRVEKDVLSIKGDELQYTANGGSTWQNVGDQDCNTIFPSSGYDSYRVRGEGVLVDIPAGTVFGMYLKSTSYDDKYFQAFSQSALNTGDRCGCGVTDDGMGTVTDVAGMLPSYASSFVVDGQMYLGFEDWPNLYKNSDMDMNDVVLAFSGLTPVTVNEEPHSAAWILACEDLGSTFDADYNDVVLKVEHISGQTTATVTPLAAGGTLASYIFFRDPTVDNPTEQTLGEIHQMFGYEQQVSGKYTPVNVSSRGTAGASRIITVGKDWSMAYYGVNDWNKNQQYQPWRDDSYVNMGGFFICVLPYDADPLPNNTSSDAPSFGRASIVATPDAGEVPEVICLPYEYTHLNTPREGQKTTYVWAWPRELCTISTDGGTSGPYPQFAAWVSDHTKSQDWYKYPNGNTVTEQSSVSSMDIQVNPSGEVDEPAEENSAHKGIEVRLVTDGMSQNNGLALTYASGELHLLADTSAPDQCWVLEETDEDYYYYLYNKGADEYLYLKFIQYSTWVDFWTLGFTASLPDDVAKAQFKLEVDNDGTLVIRSKKAGEENEYSNYLGIDGLPKVYGNKGQGNALKFRMKY